MSIADLGDIRLNYALTGPEDGIPVVFSNGLGLTLDMWDPLLPHLPDSWRILRYDRRGHGGSELTPPPYAMGQLIRDTESLLDHLGMRACLFIGLSLGGIVAQGLAVKRPDLIRALVLSNTAARVATTEIWQDRAALARASGLAALVEPTLERWFTRSFHNSPDVAMWRDMFLATPVDGWIGCAQAIGGTDFYSTTAKLALPALGIAGDRDGSTPPDLVRETTDLIAGSEFALIRRAGHLPHVEQPALYADILTRFAAKHCR